MYKNVNEKKKWFPFCQGTGPKEFARANPLFQLFQNNKRTKITNEKIKAVWKKPINVVHLDGGDDHPRTRQSTSAHRPIAVGVGVPVFFFSANQNHGNRDPWDGFVERGFYRAWNSPTGW